MGLVSLTGTPLRLVRVYWGPLLPPHLARFRSESRALGPALASERFVQLGVAEAAQELEHTRVSVAHRAGWRSAIRHLRETLRAEPADVIMSHGFIATLAAVLARRGASSAPLVYEVHGAAAFEVWRRHRQLGRALLRAIATYLLETVAMLSADRLFLVSDGILRYYPAARLKPHLSIPRLLDAAPSGDAELPAPLLAFVEGARRANRRIVVFSGGTDEWQMLDDSTRLMQKLVDTGRYVGLVLTHGVSTATALLSQLEVKPADWMVTTLPQHLVLPVLQHCDVGMLLRQRVVLNAVASPTKLYEYLYAGLAIVTTDGVPEAVAAIAQTGGGVVVSLPVSPSLDVAELDSALTTAIARARAAAGRRASYLWSSAADRFHRFLAPARVLADG